jgi:hypothetical protein
MDEIVSIEKVLNSRCSCDSDGNPRLNHWGKFIKDKHPSEETIDHVLRCCNKTPQFSNGKLLSWFESNYLFLGFEKTNDPFQTRLLHIESGMQHEAVYLACTALGIGTCISNLGINGTEYGNKMTTARHLILESAESYDEGRFTTASPGPEKIHIRSKNLPEPKRDGEVDCLPELERLPLSRNSGTQANKKDISQLLWAAKGRTPHYVKSHPWGLTIPTMKGGQNYTRVYLVKENELFQYKNWTTNLFLRVRKFWSMVGNPTHDIKSLKNVKISPQLDDFGSAIILSRNEKTNRALWEVGYMLENMLLQTNSLGISYRLKVFTNDDVHRLERNGISEAVATILL